MDTQGDCATAPATVIYRTVYGSETVAHSPADGFRGWRELSSGQRESVVYRNGSWRLSGPGWEW